MIAHENQNVKVSLVADAQRLYFLPSCFTILFALDQLAAEIANTDQNDQADALIDRCPFLRSFAASHPEAAASYRAIDS